MMVIWWRVCKEVDGRVKGTTVKKMQEGYCDGSL